MLITEIRRFMEAGDQTTQEFNPRQAALYVGLILEEVAELLRTVAGKDGYRDGHFESAGLAAAVSAQADRFKAGDFNGLLARVDRAALLDDLLDTAWTSIGLGYSIGADMPGAAGEVARSNMSKANPDTGKIDRHPLTGKLQKAPTFRPPALAPYLAPYLAPLQGITQESSN